MSQTQLPHQQQEVNLGKTIFKNLIMGGTAGIIGATCTYPLDLVKTLLQNQKSVASASGELGFIGMFSKIVKSSGVRGLYRGLQAQLIGIAPEKAIKLTVNDTMRFLFTDKKTGEIKLIHEATSGALAGLSQVVATNPYELVKVRLQTQKGVKKSAVDIIKELGFRGLFTGAGACLLRDVPFSALYFTLYGRFKLWAPKDEHGKLSPLNLFLCGIGAGAIAAGSVTPADVVKTRLQVKSEGGLKYKGIVDCFSRILKEEGPRALFKGTLPRILIVSPLFGITLATYEVLQGFFL